jgi:hypothetical protein
METCEDYGHQKTGKSLNCGHLSLSAQVAKPDTVIVNAAEG